MSRVLFVPRIVRIALAAVAFACSANNGACTTSPAAGPSNSTNAAGVSGSGDPTGGRFSEDAGSFAASASSAGSQASGGSTSATAGNGGGDTAGGGFPTGGASTAGGSSGAEASGGTAAKCPAALGVDAVFYTCHALFYVAPSGSDANAGTSPASARQTISGATRLPLKAGDCVVVGDGSYAEDPTVTTAGDADSCDGYVVFRSASPHGAKIVGSGYSALTVNANYVAVDGFDIRAAAGHAIDSDSVHHTMALHNDLHDSGGSGFSGQHGDYYHVESNVVHGNAATNAYATSGISIYQPRAIAGDAAGFHNVVRANYVYGNGEWQVQGTITDGNGIIMDDFRNTQGTGPHAVFGSMSLLENNIVFGNGGRGIHLFYTDFVTVRNNTVYSNNLDPRVVGTWNAELSNAIGANNVWANNIAYVGNGARADATAILNGCIGSGDNSDTDWWSNLTFNGTLAAPSVNMNCAGAATVTPANGNLLGVDPGFVMPSTDPVTANFHLLPHSSAKNAGSTERAAPEDYSGANRPMPPSIGAYEP